MKRFMALVFTLSIVAATGLTVSGSITAGDSGTGELVISPQQTGCIDSVTVLVDENVVVSGHGTAAGKCICISEICDESYYDDDYSSFLAVYVDEDAAPGEYEISFSVNYDDGSSESVGSSFTVVSAPEEDVDDIPASEIMTTELIVNQTWEMLHNLAIKLESTRSHAESIETKGVSLSDETRELEQISAKYLELEGRYNETVRLFNSSQYLLARENALEVQSDHYIYLARLDDVEKDIVKSLGTRNDAVVTVDEVLEDVELTIYRVAECESIGGCKQLRASADSIAEQLEQATGALESGRYSEARAIARAAEISSWDLQLKSETEINEMFSYAEGIILTDLAEIDSKGEKIGVNAPTLLSLTNTSKLGFDQRRENICRAIPTVREAADKTSKSLADYQQSKQQILTDLRAAREMGGAAVETANRNNIEIDTSECAYDLSRTLELLGDNNLYLAGNAAESAKTNCGALKSNAEKKVENQERLRSMSFASRLGHMLESLKLGLGFATRADNTLAFDENSLGEIEGESVPSLSMNPALAAFESVACGERGMIRVRSTDVQVPGPVEDPGYRRVGVSIAAEKVHKPL